MARIAFLAASDFEDAELETPRTTLREHQHQVDVVGANTSEELVGKRGDVHVTPDVSIGDVRPADFDAVVIPGGYSPDKLRTDERMVAFVREAAERGMPVAAICHAGSLLVEADVVRGCRLTSWPSIRTDLVNAGARWVDEEVVVDGNLITSREPDDLPAFSKAILSGVDDLAEGERTT